MEDLTGKKFNLWRVVNFSHRKDYTYYWNVICECGSKRKITRQSLKNETSKSCGCLFLSHGMRNHPLYPTVKNQKSRCENVNDDSYLNYGGKGIKFKFASIGDAIKYYETLGPKPSQEHTLDRLDTFGNYEIDNMGWSDKSEQSLNRRKDQRSISKFRGVSFVKKENRWVTQIKWRKNRVHIGSFKTELAAASAYLEKYFELHKKWPPEYSKTPLCYKTPLHHLGLIK